MAWRPDYDPKTVQGVIQTPVWEEEGKKILHRTRSFSS